MMTKKKNNKITVILLLGITIPIVLGFYQELLNEVTGCKVSFGLGCQLNCAVEGPRRAMAKVSQFICLSSTELLVLFLFSALALIAWAASGLFIKND